MTLNIVNLVGRAGTDPEVKYFESGKMVCNITMAVNRARRDDKPDWFNLEMWDKTAEIAGEYLRKGSQFGVTGTLKLDYWKDKVTGEERSKPVIRVERLELLGSKRDSDAANFNETDAF